MILKSAACGLVLALGAVAAFALGPAPKVPSGRASLPPGFSYTVYARDLPDVRWLRFGPDGALFASLTRPGEIVRLWGIDAHGHVQHRETVVEGLTLPHGIAFDGKAMYVAETGDILRYATGRPPATRIAGLPAGGEHFTRTIGIGPDHWLYVSVGSHCNVCEETDPRRAAISRMHLDGSHFAVYATGLRNAVGFDWDPDGRMFATDNGRDLLGDDVPPDLIVQVDKGADYGWPYATYDHHPDPAFKGHDLSHVSPPAALLPAHVAPLGLAFSTSPGFPARFRGGMFVCEHGSWDRTVPDGYQVVYLPYSKGKIGPAEPFMTGFLVHGKAWGRPVCPAIGPDGALYVSDDRAGAIYRIRYGG